MRDDDASRCQHILDHAQAERKPEMEPYGMGNHLRRKPVTTMHKGSPSDVAEVSAGRIEIEFAGARMTVIGSVAPELAEAMVAALRRRR